MQVGGHAAGGADDHVAGLGGVVDGPDDLALAGQRAVPGPVDALHLVVPVAVVPGRRSPPVVVGPPAGQGPGQRVQGLASVGDQGMAACLKASTEATLTLTKRTSGLVKMLWEEVAKSAQRVPTPTTRSASRAMALAPSVPVTPMAPRAEGWSYGIEPLPAYVSATGMPVASTRALRASVASL